jgi:hypothetical protein
MTHIEAARGLIDLDTIRSVKYRARVVKERTETSHPAIVEFYRRFQKELEARGFPFVATEFFRDGPRQMDLYESGRSRAKPGQSAHNWGAAVDVVHYGRWWDLDPKEWAIIGAIGKEVARKAKIKVEWGGDWNFYDPAHWQLKNWKAIRAADEWLQQNPAWLDQPGLDRWTMIDSVCEWQARPTPLDFGEYLESKARKAG